MRPRALIFLALIAAARPAAGGSALEAGLCRLSAEACLDAVSYELKKEPSLLGRLAPPSSGTAAALCSPLPATQADLFEKAAAAAAPAGLSREERTAAESAVAAARAYIAPEALPLMRPAAAPAPAAPPPDLASGAGGAAGVSGIDTCSLDWKDASGYAASRLGPLRAVLDALGPGDRIVLSNLRLAQLPPGTAGKGPLAELHLPVSGYAKKLWLGGDDGGRVLIATDMQGASFLRHYELLLRRYYCGRAAPEITAAEAPSAYAPYYKALSKVNGENGGALSGLSGLISGYAEAFRVYWKDLAAGSFRDAAGDWQVDVYRLPGAGLWGVVSAHSPYYGEILGENIRYLVAESTGIRTVVLAGSGGSLDPRPLYSVAYPSDVLAPGGAGVPNALASLADYRAHESVLSPLQETPGWLARARAAGVSTVDAEMGPAAGALAPLGLRLGFAVLVTDYPVRGPVTERLLERASLAAQDPGAKYRGLAAYSGALEAWIRGGPPPGWQPEELALGRPLAEQSALNLAAGEKALRPLRPGEEALLARLERFFRDHPPSFSVRVSSARAAHVLEDGELLSTLLVSSLKGSAVAPFTPSYEDLAYGAYGYVFGTLSYWDGPEKYGGTVLRLKPEVWRRRAWATRRSAMRALALEAEKAGTSLEKAQLDPALKKAAGELFGSWVVVPSDLPRALALQTVGELRALPPRAFRDFSEAADGDIPGLISRYDVAWLEGKIRGSVRAEDIDLVKTPLPAPAAIAGPADRLGIRVVPPGNPEGPGLNP